MSKLCRDFWILAFSFLIGTLSVHCQRLEYYNGVTRVNKSGDGFYDNCDSSHNCCGVGDDGGPGVGGDDCTFSRNCLYAFSVSRISNYIYVDVLLNHSHPHYSNCFAVFPAFEVDTINGKCGDTNRVRFVLLFSNETVAHTRTKMSQGLLHVRFGPYDSYTKIACHGEGKTREVKQTIARVTPSHGEVAPSSNLVLGAISTIAYLHIGIPLVKSYDDNCPNWAAGKFNGLFKDRMMTELTFAPTNGIYSNLGTPRDQHKGLIIRTFPKHDEYLSTSEIETNSKLGNSAATITNIVGTHGLIMTVVATLLAAWLYMSKH